MDSNQSAEPHPTDDDFIQIARQHPMWHQISEAWRDQGIPMTPANECIAGRMIYGDLTLAEAVKAVRANAGIPLQAEHYHFSTTTQ